MAGTTVLLYKYLFRCLIRFTKHFLVDERDMKRTKASILFFSFFCFTLKRTESKKERRKRIGKKGVLHCCHVRNGCQYIKVPYLSRDNWLSSNGIVFECL